MNVAIVGPTFPHRGGISQYTTLLASKMSRSHTVRLYGFRRQYPDRLFPGRSQIDLSARSPVEHETRRWLIPWWPPTWVRVAREWAAWEPDVVVVQWWVPFMAPMTAWLANQARRMGIRVSTVCHNVLPHERGHLDAMLVRLALRDADRLVVHGTQDRDRAYALLPECTVEVTQLPSLADFYSAAWTRDHARAPLGVDGRVLLFFGLVRPYKGLMDLLDALPDVLSQFDVTLLVVGEVWGGAQRYHDRVKTLGLESRVRFVDRYVPNDEAAMYFAAADLVVLPYREATGSAVLPLAFGLGVPVVATRTGGMGEMVQDGVTGFLVDPGDVAGLAWAITRFFREDRAETFRHNLQLRPDRSGWNKIVEAVLNFD